MGFRWTEMPQHNKILSRRRLLIFTIFFIVFLGLWHSRIHDLYIPSNIGPSKASDTSPEVSNPSFTDIHNTTLGVNLLLLPIV